MRRHLRLLLVATMLLTLTGCTSAPAPSSSTQTPSQVSGEGVVVEVIADHLSFAPAELRVKQGQTVTVRVTSQDGLHDWVLDAFDAATGSIGAGQTKSVTFVADRAGTFEFYCSISNHRQLGMTGALIVE